MTSILAITAVVAGCASARRGPPPSDLSPEHAATALQVRSLGDADLHRYLAANLGRDPKETWDFEALCWVAFYYNPSLRVARAQWDTARAAQRTAAQRPNPGLTLTPGYDFTHQAGLSPWMPSVGLDFLVPTNGKRRHQEEIAAAEADAARLAVDSTVWQVRGELRNALLDAEIAGRRAELLVRQSDAQQALVRLLEQRLSAGAIATPEVLVARTAWLRSEAAAVEAKAQSDAARSRVAAALGVPAEALANVALPPVPRPVPLSATELAAAKRAALVARADVLAALAKYRSANAALALELAKRFPDVHLGPGYQYDQGLNKWTLGLTFELPVFNRNEGPIAEATARRAEAAAQFERVQTQALAAIETAASALSAANAQWQRMREIEAQTQAQRQAAAQRLQVGGADETEVKSAEIDVETADGSVLDASAAVAIAAGQLEDALQVPFPNFSAVAEAVTTEKTNRP